MEIPAAPNYTICETSPKTVSTGSIFVHGIFIRSGQLTGKIFTFYEGDGTTVIGTAYVQTASPFEYVQPFLAPRGLVISGCTDSNNRVTVFHSNEGS